MPDSQNSIINILIPVLIIIAVTILIGLILRKKSKFKSLHSLHRRYLLQMIRLLVILACLADILTVIDPTIQIHQLLFRGSALIVAIVGFAAQTAMSDLICGLLISIHKPFEIGDRIIIEGLEPHSTDYYELMRGLNIKEPDKACDTLTKALRERLEDLNDYEQYVKESWRK